MSVLFEPLGNSEQRLKIKRFSSFLFLFARTGQNEVRFDDADVDTEFTAPAYGEVVVNVPGEVNIQFISGFQRYEVVLNAEAFVSLRAVLTT